jgi:hypothetical protein
MAGRPQTTTCDALLAAWVLQPPPLGDGLRGSLITLARGVQQKTKLFGRIKILARKKPYISVKLLQIEKFRCYPVSTLKENYAQKSKKVLPKGYKGWSGLK